MTEVPSPPKSRREPGFVAKVLIVAAVAVVLLTFWRVSSVFVLAFGGIVFAVALDHIASFARRLGVSHGIALLLAVTGLLLIAVLFFVVFGARAFEQFTALAEELPRAWQAAVEWLQSFAVGRWLISVSGNAMEGGGSTLLSALPIAGGVLGGIANAALMIVIGIYLAADAESYRQGTLRLFPPARRARVNQIMVKTGRALRSWLAAMSLDMIFLGVVTGVGLWLVGVPLALALGVLSGLSVFVPFIGPLVATVPGLLLALSVSPELALYALGVYLVAQQLEGNVTLPLLQRWTVSMPPALMLLSMVAFGLLFGLWGVLLATPLAVAAMTLIRMAYVEDMVEADTPADNKQSGKPAEK